MTKEKLNQAKEIERKLDEFKSANQCFWHNDYSLKSDGSRYSTNPKIIIEFDDEDDSRRKIKLPLILSDKFIEFMQNVIDEKIDELEKEFDSL